MLTRSAGAQRPWGLRWCQALSAYAFVGGAASFLGWALDVPRLANWNGDGIAIQPNAAVLLMLAGASLLLHLRARRAAALALGAFVAAVGALLLLQHFVAADFGIHHPLTFGRSWGQLSTVTPGRVGPPASAAFTLIGLALVLLSRRGAGAASSSGRRWVPRLGVAVGMIVLLSLLGYLFGASQFYAIPWLSAIALQTVTMLLAIGIALVLAVPEHEPLRLLLAPSATGAMARRILPVLIVLPPALMWLRIRGEALGLYDTGGGRTLLVLVLVVSGLALMWWSLRSAAQKEEERLRSERALQASQAQLASIFGVSAVGMAQADPATRRFVRVNPALCAMTGYREAELLAMTVDDLNHPDDRARDAAAYQQITAGGGPYRIEKRYRVKDGRSLWVLVTGDVLRDADGRPLLAFAVIQDITERRLAEDEIRRAHTELREADRRKDEFLATLAHELRNPLAPVRNAVQILRMKGADPATQRWCEDVIERQVQQMTRLIDELLDISRISLGKIELKRERVALADVVRAAVEVSRPLLEQAGQTLDVELPREPLALDADLTRLAQVFGNLLNNAAKYSEPGGRIGVRAVAAGGEVVLTVRDSGVGIPQHMLDKVFEPFMQVDRSLEKARGGLGIGLTLVKRLVELHGGRVEAHSEGLGRGSRFVVRLPLVPAAGPEPAAPADRASASELPARRVLIVDDNRDAADSLARLMELHGCDTRVALDGDEARSLAAAMRPDLVLLDIGLPRVSGYDVARAIRREPWGEAVVIVAVSGWGTEADRARSRDAGFDLHLVKPVEPQALVRALAALRRPAVAALR